MKLLKKLLPIATVASLATVVTPLTVSCGTKTVKGISELNYMPNIEMHEAAYYDDYDDATEEYFTKVKANPDIFVQDFYWFQSQIQTKLNDYLTPEADISNFKFNIYMENVEVSTKTDEAGDTHYLMSFDMDYSWELSGKYDDYDLGYKVTYSLDGSMERHMHLVNIPFVMEWDGDVYHWFSTVDNDVDIDEVSPDWEIKSDVCVDVLAKQTSKYGTYIDEEDSANYKFNLTNNIDNPSYPREDQMLFAGLTQNYSYYFLMVY